MSWPTKKVYFEDAKYKTKLTHHKYQRAEKKTIFSDKTDSVIRQKTKQA